jgi:drug/metabolite transporter (DMT)-like permease
MGGVALSLVLVAALVHAVWNLLAKRVGRGGAAFVALVAITGTVLYAPAVAVLLAVQRPAVDLRDLAVMAASGLVHLGYFVLLQRGYQVGDLSVVYPLARGTGPLLSGLAAIAFLGERPTPLALAGGACVIGGVVALGAIGTRGGDGAARAGARTAGAAYGVATGLLIAVYTLLDAQAVAALALPPLLYDWGGNAVRSVIMSPVAWRRRAEVADLWRGHRGEILAIAALTPAAYILVLIALSLAPVSYVAPAREFSIVIGTFLGARLLHEGRALPRVGAAAVVTLGVFALALG